jgi:Plasmid pRiA4b ORF-3-like protein
VTRTSNDPFAFARGVHDEETVIIARAMADWMTVRVELVSGQGENLDERPGRIFLAGPNHTFRDLADAINLHFARWDLAHLYLFKLKDGREIGFPDAEYPEQLDHEAVKLSPTVVDGEQFEYVFDFGEEWTHLCRVTDIQMDLTELSDDEPEIPIPIWGWGSIPDQYGRRSENEDGDA